MPIDDTRLISNQSTGKLGQLLALGLDKLKAKVTLLEGPVEEPLQSSSIRIKKFAFFDELLKLLKFEVWQKYDIIIHAAAVSDYRLKKAFKTKIPSSLKALTLTLTPTPKIINEIKKIDPKSFLVGFKLESRISPQRAVKATRDLFTKAHCDLVVANSIQNKNYLGYIVNREKNILSEAKSRKELVRNLLKILQNLFKRTM